MNEPVAAFEPQLKALCQESGDFEIIVVDGGRKAATISSLPDDLTKVPTLRLIASEPGRGLQLAKGARLAQGDVLVLLHADTTPPKKFFQEIVRAIEQENCQAGAFRFKLDADGWHYRFIEWCVYWRCRFFSLPYGDQIIFVKKDLLERSGGIKPLPLLEDLELVLRLKRGGVKIHMLRKPAITSARRWRSQGIIKTTLRNSLYLLLFALGVHPRKIVQLEKHFS
jgi:rSAM/selenodomain-associated transferase 2